MPENPRKIIKLTGNFDLSNRGVSPEMEDVLSRDSGRIEQAQRTKEWLSGLQSERERKMAETSGYGDISNVLGIAKAPAATLMDEAMTAADKYSRIGDEPTDVSMVPTKANLARFLSAMSQNIRPGPTRLPEADLATAYVKARYPNRANTLEPLRSSYVDPERPGRLGSFVPPTKYEKLGTTVRSYSKDPDEASVDQVRKLVGVLGHEGQHGVDHMRVASPITKAEFVPESKGGLYVTPSSSFERYQSQPVEARAFQAGSTAMNSFDRFMDLLPGTENKLKTLRGYLK